MIRSALALPAFFALLACSPGQTSPSDPVAQQTAIPVEPDGGLGDGAPPLGEVSADDNRTEHEEPSAFAQTFPAALRGTWRVTDGPAPTNAQCDNTVGENMGKVLTVGADSYSFFETGGRFLEVSDRSEGMIRARFDTTYADEATSAELIFAVDPVARTLTVSEPGAGAQVTKTYKRCPR